MNFLIFCFLCGYRYCREIKLYTHDSDNVFIKDIIYIRRYINITSQTDNKDSVYLRRCLLDKVPSTSCCDHLRIVDELIIHVCIQCS